MEWSETLLSDRERRLLRRLVFEAGSTLEAAEDVACGPDLPRDQVLHLVGAASLPRMLLLLLPPGEGSDLRNAHAKHFTAIAWPEEVPTVARLDRHRDTSRVK